MYVIFDVQCSPRVLYTLEYHNSFIKTANRFDLSVDLLRESFELLYISDRTVGYLGSKLRFCLSWSMILKRNWIAYHYIGFVTLFLGPVDKKHQQLIVLQKWEV